MEILRAALEILGRGSNECKQWEGKTWG